MKGKEKKCKIVPDRQSFVNVKRDYPNEPESERFLLAQADMLLREYRYVRQSDGSYERPKGRRKTHGVGRGGRRATR